MRVCTEKNKKNISVEGYSSSSSSNEVHIPWQNYLSMVLIWKRSFRRYMALSNIFDNGAYCTTKK
jgi:hypothetical protein